MQELKIEEFEDNKIRIFKGIGHAYYVELLNNGAVKEKFNTLAKDKEELVLQIKEKLATNEEEYHKGDFIEVISTSSTVRNRGWGVTQGWWNNLPKVGEVLEIAHEQWPAQISNGEVTIITKKGSYFSMRIADIKHAKVKKLKSNEVRSVDGSKIVKIVGPLGKSNGMGGHVYCPRCGFKLVDKDKWSSGYGSASSSGVTQYCNNCGYKESLTFD